MPDLTDQRLRRAFARLAEEVHFDPPVELVVVGGAAGLLSQYLPGHRTTVDCDVIVWTPPESWPQLVEPAKKVAVELDLPQRWLDNGAQVFRHCLLPGWETRRVEVFRGGGLAVYTPSRVDYLCMKIMAGRAIDVDDVISMDMTGAEHAFIRHFLRTWPRDHFASETIPKAVELLDAVMNRKVPDESTG